MDPWVDESVSRWIGGSVLAGSRGHGAGDKKYRHRAQSTGQEAVSREQEQESGE